MSGVNEVPATEGTSASTSLLICDIPNCEDTESIKGRFGFQTIATYHVPYIIRVINGESVKFVSVRIAETFLLCYYLHKLHLNIFTCTNIRGYSLTSAEAKLFNEINLQHCDAVYGNKLSYTENEYIVRLEDVEQLYTFLELCYDKLLNIITPGKKEKCGFLRINSKCIVPYCLKNCIKYLPIFFFEGETEYLDHQAINLENWDLAYLKFCFKVQGIKDELFDGDSCAVTSLDEIKKFFPPESNFEEFWPINLRSNLVIKINIGDVNSSCRWVKTLSNF